MAFGPPEHVRRPLLPINVSLNRFHEFQSPVNRFIVIISSTEDDKALSLAVEVADPSTRGGPEDRAGVSRLDGQNEPVGQGSLSAIHVQLTHVQLMSHAGKV